MRLRHNYELWRSLSYFLHLQSGLVNCRLLNTPIDGKL